MRNIHSFPFFCLFALALTGCSGSASRSQATQVPAAPAVDQLIDTTKLKTDLDNVLSSVASGKPDTNALKQAAKDVLTTTHDMLSDSGIDKLYGTSNDPAVREAAETLKKYRNGIGITPAGLDSMKKAADLLKTN